MINIAGGNQEEFDGDSFRTAAIGGAIGGALSPATNGAVEGGKAAAAAGYAALGNMIGQGIAVELGYQEAFSWASVATAAIGGATNASTNGGNFGTDLMLGLWGGVLRGKEFDNLDMASVALNAFGQAIGNSIAERLTTTSEQRAWKEAKQHALEHPEVLADPVMQISLTPEAYADRQVANGMSSPVLEANTSGLTLTAARAASEGAVTDPVIQQQRDRSTDSAWQGSIVDDGSVDIAILSGLAGDSDPLLAEMDAFLAESDAWMADFDSRFSSVDAYFEGMDLSMPVYEAPEETSLWDMAAKALKLGPAGLAIAGGMEAYKYYGASPDAELHRVQTLNTALGLGEYLLQPIALARDVFYEMPKAMITGEDANFYSIAGRNLMNGGSREDFYLDIADSSGIFNVGSSSYRATRDFSEGDWVGGLMNTAGVGLNFLGAKGINGNLRFNYAGTGLGGLKEFGLRLFSRSGKLNASPGSINYMSEGDRFSIYASKRSDIDPNGSLDVIGHGTADTFQIESLKGISGVKGVVNPKTGEVDHRLLANIIKNNPEYNGQNIRLLSCSTGSCDVGLAQNLANKLNVTVEAPSDILWATEKGDLFISSSKVIGGVKMPVWPPNGQWKTFIPGGNK